MKIVDPENQGKVSLVRLELTRAVISNAWGTTLVALCKRRQVMSIEIKTARCKDLSSLTLILTLYIVSEGSSRCDTYLGIRLKMVGEEEEAGNNAGKNGNIPERIGDLEWNRGDEKSG
jgi:hypothetical protein